MYTSSFNGVEIDHLLGLAAIGEYKQLTDVDTFEVGNYYVASGSAMNALPNKTKLPAVLQANPAGFTLYIRRVAMGVGSDPRVLGFLFPNNEGMFLIMKSNTAGTDWETNFEFNFIKEGWKKYGPTSDRPSGNTISRGILQYGYVYFDVTLGKPVFYVGNAVDGQGNTISATGWVDATGSSV